MRMNSAHAYYHETSRDNEAGYAYLLLTNHPLATKLESTTSACDLVMLRLFVSRSAAIDDIQKASLGAVAI